MKRFPKVLLLALLAGCSSPDTVREKDRQEVISSPEHAYQISVGGRLDMDNTMTRTYDDITIAFQNNLSLTIANTGESIVRNPRVTANDRGRWWSLDTILEEALDGATTSLDSILFIHDFVQKNRYHDFPLFTNDALHDPVAMFNEYGAGLCDDAGIVTCSLLHHAGLNADRFGKDPRVRTLKGHMMVEASSDSGFMFLDSDENTFYLDFENERPVGGRAIARDHYLAKREVVFGPLFTGLDSGVEPAALFGVDDGYILRSVAGRAIDFELRPGERIEYRWDNRARHMSGDVGNQTRRTWGTSLWAYDVPMAEIPPSGEPLIIPMEFPYAFCGARVRLDLIRHMSLDSLTVSISPESVSWIPVKANSVSGSSAQALVEWDLGVPAGNPLHRFRIKVDRPELVQGITVEADLLVWPLSLPRLHVGANEITYQDDTTEPHEVTVTHRWREADQPAPPKAIRKALSPRPGATVAAATVPFSWKPVADAEHYHIQVSRRPDMRLPYRPCFDVYVDTTAHHSPFAGLFNPDEDYYWRVRAQNNSGIWGEWSKTWSFRWAGPRVPVELEGQFQGRRVTMSWRPNARGPQPDHFEVYGSNERGFTPSKIPYDVFGLGRQPANLIGTTRDTSLLIVDCKLTGAGLNKAFYRVVSVDSNGTPSGPSAQLELPHPFIITTPPDFARVGELWEYRPETLVSLGDLQSRYVAPIYTFWEREGYTFEVTEGPAWLTWDEKTGVLGGTPAKEDTGLAQVTLTCHRTYPDEVGPEEHQASHFQKTHVNFQASDSQTFEVRVEPLGR
jgi:hypothetical protein